MSPAEPARRSVVEALLGLKRRVGPRETKRKPVKQRVKKGTARRTLLPVALCAFFFRSLTHNERPHKSCNTT
jgi:hypothetical protein